MLKFTIELDSNVLQSAKIESASEYKRVKPSQDVMRRLARQGLMIAISMRGNTVKLYLVGKLKASSSALFKEFLHSFLNQGYTSFVFDLSGLNTLDAAGVAVLVWAGNQAKSAGGRGSVINPTIPLYRQLVSVNFHHLVPIENFVLS
jgi:anti-anti-sigma factor